MDGLASNSRSMAAERRDRATRWAIWWPPPGKGPSGRSTGCCGSGVAARPPASGSRRARSSPGCCSSWRNRLRREGRHEKEGSHEDQGNSKVRGHVQMRHAGEVLPIRQPACPRWAGSASPVRNARLTRPRFNLDSTGGVSRMVNAGRAARPGDLHDQALLG